MGLKKAKKIGIKPEKKVEQEVLAWAFINRWSLHVFDSKMIYSEDNLRTNQGLPVGCSDLVGNCPLGLAAFVELKAEKKDHSCRLSQYQFLSRKIESNALACVVSSAAQLEEIYKTWSSLRNSSLQEARAYLKAQLPKKVLVNGRVLTLQES